MVNFYAVYIGESKEDFKDWASGKGAEVEWFIVYDTEGKFNLDNVIERCVELDYIYPEDTKKVIWVWEEKDLDLLKRAVREEIMFSLA